VVKSIPAHPGGAQGLFFHRDGTIVTSGRDKSAKSWKSDGTAIITLEPLTDLALRVAVSENAQVAFVGDWNGNVHAYYLATGKKFDLLPSNPPSLKDRVEFSTKEIAALKVELEKSKVELTNATNQDVKLKVDISAAQKNLADATLNVTDLPAKIKILTTEQTSLTALQAKAAIDLKASEALVIKSTETGKTLKDQSDKNKLDALAAKNAQVALEQLEKNKLDVPVKKKAVEEKTAALAVIATSLKAAQTTLLAAQPLVPALPKQIDALQKALPAAAALVSTITVKVQGFEKQIGAKEASLARYKKSQPLAIAPKS